MYVCYAAVMANIMYFKLLNFILCRVFESGGIHPQGVQYFLLDVGLKVHLSLAVVLY